MPLYKRTVTPITSGWTVWHTGGTGNLLNGTSGTSATPVNGTIYWAAVPILHNCDLTGVLYTVGNTGGTDKVIGALYDASGTLVATSATAGTTVGTANTKQKLPFTAVTTVLGPGLYFIAIQMNGTTARFMAFSNATEGFVTGSTTGTFGTLPSITPGTTYTTGVGPFASTY